MFASVFLIRQFIMQSSPLLENLIEHLRCLPGVGPKSAQRMAYHLLQRDRSGGMNLAGALTEAMSKIGHCTHCRTLRKKRVVQFVIIQDDKIRVFFVLWNSLPIFRLLSKQGNFPGDILC